MQQDRYYVTEYTLLSNAYVHQLSLHENHRIVWFLKVKNLVVMLKPFLGHKF
jgi:hypothetical protein